MLRRKPILIIILILLLIISIVLVGILTYKWWQTKNELARQSDEHENLVKQLMEVRGKLEKNAFQQCGRLKIVEGKGITVSFTAELINGESIWDIFVVDPDGFVVGNRILAVPGMYFSAGPGGNKDELLIGVDIPELKAGDYLIAIIPIPGRDLSSANTYTLELVDLTIAKNIPYSVNFFDRLYILRSTEDGIIPIVPVSVGCQF